MTKLGLRNSLDGLLPALLCGLGYGAGLVESDMPLRPWLAVLSLWFYLHSLKGLSTVRQACGSGLVFGLALVVLSTSWLGSIFGQACLFLWLYQSLYFMAFAGAWHWLSRRCSPWLAPVALACLWSAIEWLRAEQSWLAFPWLTLAHVVGPHWLLPWVGCYGLSFALVFSFGYLALLPPLMKPFWKRVAVGTWVGLNLLFVMAEPEMASPIDPAKRVTVAAIQAEGTLLEGYAELTRSFTQPADVIVWPEYALPYDVMKSKRHSKALLALAAEKKATLVLGTQTQQIGEAWSNTALTLDATGERGRHFKKHTVHFFDDGTPGTTALPVKTAVGLVGTPICFDNDFSDVVREMTAAGAEFFAVPSMDPASWGKQQHRQHAMLFRLRAAENGRWMVIASSSGVTQVIDPQGRVRDSLDVLIKGRLRGEVERLTELTPYTRWGWRLPWVFVTGAGLFLLRAWICPAPRAQL